MKNRRDFLLESMTTGIAVIHLPRLITSAKAEGAVWAPAMPAANPWLADSVYPTSHFNTGATD